MAEKIKDLCQSIEKDGNSSQEQKNKAQEVCRILTQKGKAQLQVNADARNDALNILKEVSLDAAMSADLIEPNLSPAPETKSAETKVSEVSQGSGDEIYHELERQGWDDVYLVAKMISLGYIPKTHDGKHTGVTGNVITAPVKWVWKNAGYMIQGGPLTNGTVNEPFIKAQDEARKWMTGLFIGEETQLKVLLKSVTGADTIGDRNIINQRLQALNDFKNAVNNGNINAIKTAAHNYSSIGEETGKLKDLFKKYGVPQTVKGELEKSKQTKEKTKRESLEKDIAAQRKEIGYKLEDKITVQEAEIKRLQGEDENAKKRLQDELRKSEDQKTRFNNEKIDLEGEKTSFVNDKTHLERKYENTIRDINTELKVKGGGNPTIIANLESEKNRLDAEISRVTGEIQKTEREITQKGKEIRNTETDITNKQRAVDDFKPAQTANIKKAEDLKNLYEELAKANASGDHAKTKVLLEQYQRKVGSPLELEVGKNHEAFMSTDQNARLEKEVKKAGGVTTAGEGKKEVKKAVTQATEKEIASITAEIQKIEAEIDKIRKEAEAKLTDFQKTASKTPNEVPKLRGEIEAIVEKMNVQIKDLEARGVKNLKTLNPKDLELFATQSKWTQKMVQANGWVDGRMGGVGGKIVGVGAIALLAKGAYDGIGKDGILTKETGLNIADIGLGMIPIAGGAYDLWRAWEGTDLNGRKMESSERWMRTGFGVVGLIPGVGTAVKWAATAGKIGKAGEMASYVQKGELITQAGHLTGKVAGIGMLGYGGLTTVTYMMDEAGKKIVN